ncbi:sulfite exporter TauE/SafE family protein [Photobacterium sp. DNB23_23_1]
MELLWVILSFDGALKLVLGAIIGLCLGLTGVGGGVLIIPILQFFFGMGTVTAVGTASLISMFVKLNAGFSHIKAGNVAWRKLGLMLLGAVPATWFITEWVVYFNNHDQYSHQITQAIDIAIVGIMLLSLFSLYKKRNSSISSSANSQPESGKAKAVCAGGVCGAVLGSTGVGGGVLLLPAFNSLLGIDLKKSIGSSVVMALALSGITALNYSRGGQSDIATAALMTAGAFLGVPIAIRLLERFSENQLYSLTLLVIFISLCLTLM